MRPFVKIWLPVALVLLMGLAPTVAHASTFRIGIDYWLPSITGAEETVGTLETLTFSEPVGPGPDAGRNGDGDTSLPLVVVESEPLTLEPSTGSLSMLGATVPAGTLILSGAFCLDADTALSASYWELSSSDELSAFVPFLVPIARADGLTEPEFQGLRIAGMLFTDPRLINLLLPQDYCDPPSGYCGEPVVRDVDARDGEVGIDFVATTSLGMSSLDLLYEKKIVETPSATLWGMAGMKRGTFSQTVTTDLTSPLWLEFGKDWYDEYYDPAEDPYYAEYEYDWIGAYFEGEFGASSELSVGGTLWGPQVAAKGSATLFEKMRLDARVGCSVLLGEVTRTGVVDATLAGYGEWMWCGEWGYWYYDTDEEEWYIGGYEGATESGSFYVGSEEEPAHIAQFHTEVVQQATVPVLDLDIGLSYPITDFLEVNAGYKLSTWFNVPDVPKPRVTGDVVAAIIKALGWAGDLWYESGHEGEFPPLDIYPHELPGIEWDTESTRTITVSGWKVGLTLRF